METKNKNHLKRLFKFWAPPLVWATIIFLFSTFPANPVSKIYWKEFFVKKSAHIIEYGIFATFLYRAFVNSEKKKKISGFLSIFISFLYGASDEFHQSFTPGREPMVRDVIFDTIGAVVAIYLIWNYLPKAPKKLKNLAKRLQLI